MSNAQAEAAQVSEPPSPEVLCLQMPLYKKLRLRNEQNEWVVQLEDYRGALDMYCPDCKRHTVFSGSKFPAVRLMRETRPRSVFDNRIFNLEFFCPRDPAHRAVFVFRLYKGTLEKVGQFPSIADIAAPDLQKYRMVLGDDRLSEFARGVGLAAHGVGVGAFVYLRRIFESLISEAKLEASTHESWIQKDFEQSRMDQKILMLKENLPAFLVENRVIYGIMSHGVHELSDDECLAAFPLIRMSIELMLDEIIEKRARAMKLEAARKSLSSLGGALKARNAKSK